MVCFVVDRGGACVYEGEGPAGEGDVKAWDLLGRVKVAVKVWASLGRFEAARRLRY